MLVAGTVSCTMATAASILAFYNSYQHYQKKNEVCLSCLNLSNNNSSNPIDRVLEHKGPFAYEEFVPGPHVREFLSSIKVLYV